MDIDKVANISALSGEAPETKLTLGLVTLLLCLVSTHWLAFVFMFCLMAALTLGKAKIPIGYYIKLLSLPFVFLVFGVLGILLQVDLSRGLYLGFSPQAFPTAASMVGKALAAVSCLYFMILTTPIRDIIAVLNFLRCPNLLISLATLMYRCIFILMEVASVKVKSMQCRQGLRYGRGFLKSLGMLWGSVFVGSLRNSEWMYKAMLIRGYDGTLQFLPRDVSLGFKDVVMNLTVIVITVGIHYLPSLRGA